MPFSFHLPLHFPFRADGRAFSFLNNSLEAWTLALAMTVLAGAAMLFLRRYVLRHVAANARKTETNIDDFLAAMLSRTYFVFIAAFAMYFGSTFLDLNAKRDLFVARVAVGALLLQLAIWGDVGLRAWRDRVRLGGDGERRASRSVLTFMLRLALWTIVTLMVLDNFGINITTLVASLGVGGIAVALATQNILGDLFASLSIMLDKPFEIGDFIIVGDVLGSVEHIGLKTTRLRGLGGEQVVFSNGDLLKSRIHNHKRMETRRNAFVLRVAYGTSEEQLCRVPRIIREIIGAKPNIDFERAHFFRWSEWSLDFEIVYHFRSPDYILHMDAQQDIFLDIYRRFQQEGIQFAHPMSIVRLGEPVPGGMAAGRPAGAMPPGPSFH
ncbi:mechanosensitive ion channel family protein [Herbaspirillum sp. SJZ107]|uniref:mechanosensitive ion channel family protein n=1 Tax=Herbaspirillum sp. SJZ107 TaxID=2572881 RepID=UPI00116B03F6|nr:mechanosensitive ion channel family protein [Herbaspirillum sp. SJZ107]TQK11591.1 small-conductance mechanosensitive channel [Herbaspirillum sp. SJZ107]